MIINVNDAWLNFAINNGISSMDKVNVGLNYFDVCRNAQGEHSEEAGKALEGLLSILAGKISDFELEYPCDSPSEKRWFLMRASAFSIKNRRYLVVNHINITERKAAESALRRSHTELEDRVTERTAQLERLNRELRDKIAEQEGTTVELKNAKAEAELYVDLMGHDINNMNMVALGHLELTLKKLQTEENRDEDAIEHVSGAITTLNNISKLISNVRIIQQARGGQLEIRVIDIGTMLAEVVHEYRNAPGREVIINYKPVKGYFVKTCELFKDVFTNIVGNSIKHSKGPLIISIEIEKVRQGDTDYYQISVEDNGPGIPDKRKSELFKPRNPEGAKAKRIGVGLILARTLVEDFNGKIWVEDRIPGDYTQGARFVVMLPAVKK